MPDQQSRQHALNAAMDANHAARELMQALAIDDNLLYNASIYVQRIELAKAHLKRATDYLLKANLAATTG